jgi:hypothetical protein
MTPRRPAGWVALAVLAAVAALSGLGQRADTASDATPDPGAATPTMSGPAAELLDTLTVAPETGTAGYDRDRFGAGWQTGPDGCDTRDAVLATESLAPPRFDGCTVVAGEWVSAWDGARLADPSGLDVDHLVPLAEAWASGASSWPAARRVAFANDVDPARPDALVAVTAAANRAKGDRDPAEWLPPDRAVWCRYANAWITLKAAWSLTIDADEHQALTDALATCPTEGADR